jgi:hypothetical protein
VPGLVRSFGALLLGPLMLSLCSAAHAQAWVPATDEGLRSAVELLADERVIDIPLMYWPIARAELQRVSDQAAGRKDLTPAQQAALQRVQRALNPAPRELFLAGGEPSDLRSFEDAPRGTGEAGVVYRLGGTAGFSGELKVRAVSDPKDAQVLRPDGSYAAIRMGNWLETIGWQDRWWGAGYDGSLEFSSNARPPFAISLDRETSTAPESRWLHWIGPWTLGTFMGMLERDRSDVDHALLWGARASMRPLPGFEFSVTRNAQWCGSGRPCGLRAFRNVVFGRDNQGENVSAAQEPGNQLATYEARWGGRIWNMPVSFYFQNTGETIDNHYPRPLRTLTLLGASTWGRWHDAYQWRAHFEFTDTTCADWTDTRTPDCAYENHIFTAGYRYRGRTFGHSTDSDSIQFVLGLSVDGPGDTSWSARLRNLQANRLGAVPQVNDPIAKSPQRWWVGEGTYALPFANGRLEAAFGLEYRDDLLADRTSWRPRGYLRWTKPF